MTEHPERLAAFLYKREYLGDGIVIGLSVPRRARGGQAVDRGLNPVPSEWEAEY